MKRTSNYIATIPMKSEDQVLEVKKVLEQIFGWVTLRGRHSNRKSVVKGWRKSRQNDVPWRKAEYIDIYLHYQNPNYMRVFRKEGMLRNNLRVNADSVIAARCVGQLGLGLSDLTKYQEETQQKDMIASVISLHNEVKMKDPKYRRKEMKRRYQNKRYTLKKGDWGYIAQELLDYTSAKVAVSFTELKAYYDIVLRGNQTIQKGGSFIHHLQSLVKPSNAVGRRCKRHLYKDSYGKYSVMKTK